MGSSEDKGTEESPSGPPPGAPRPDLTTLAIVTGWLIIAAASWYLLKEFAGLLRPLLLAVFLCYIILPVHIWLKRTFPGYVAVGVMVGVSVGLLYLLALMIHNSVVELNEDLPRLTKRAESIFYEAKGFLDENLPWLIPEPTDAAGAEKQRLDLLRNLTHSLVNTAGNALVEAFVVGFYMLFLLMEAGHLPHRIRSAFGGERSGEILAVAATINKAIASYLRVKVKASLLLAVPVALVLWICGVKFAVLWGVLTFIGNFIPYVGSIVAASLPILFAFLQLPLGWQPIAAAACVLTVHVVMTYLVEPSLIGRGVGLSPVVILAALAFWGLCWGPVGMFLAIPLTVMLRIILENVAFTRPFARLLGDE
jgi:AI-2 transport protein TqsA